MQIEPMKGLLTKFGVTLGALMLVGAGCAAPAPITTTSEETSVAGDAMAVPDGGIAPSDDMVAENEGMESEDAAVEQEVTDVMEDAEDSMMMEEKADVIVAVSGVNFAFDKTEIRVKKGQTVRIDFTSASGFHDWVVDAFDAATAQVQTGDSSSVTFVADEAGTFEYYCSVGQHRQMGMVGKLIVE